MAFAEGKLALDAGAAGLNLMTSVLTLVATARNEGRDDPGFAEIMALLPGQVFGLSKELLNICEELKQDFLDAEVSLDESIESLQASYGWWHLSRHRLFRKFESRANAINDRMGHFLDDFLYAARCSKGEESVAKAFAEARVRQADIDSINYRSRPVRDILDAMIQHASDLRDEAQVLRSYIS